MQIIFSTNVQIVGITSWEARGCGHPEHPGVFLQVKEKLSNILYHLLRNIQKCENILEHPQVSYFLDWIASH